MNTTASMHTETRRPASESPDETRARDDRASGGFDALFASLFVPPQAHASTARAPELSPRNPARISSPLASAMFEAPAPPGQRQTLDTLKEEARRSDLHDAGRAHPAPTPQGDPSQRPKGSGGAPSSLEVMHDKSPETSAGCARLEDLHASGARTFCRLTAQPRSGPPAPEAQSACTTGESSEHRLNDIHEHRASGVSPNPATSDTRAVSTRMAAPGESPAHEIAKWLAGEIRQAEPGAKEHGSTANVPAAHSQAGRVNRTPQSGASHRETPRPQADPANRPSRVTEFEKMVKSLRLRHEPHQSWASIELDPPELGRIRVQARLTGARLDLDIRAESPAARTAIEASLPELRKTLEDQGVRTGSFDTHHGPLAEESNGQQAGLGSNKDGARDAYTLTPGNSVIATPASAQEPRIEGADGSSGPTEDAGGGARRLDVRV